MLGASSYSLGLNPPNGLLQLPLLPSVAQNGSYRGEDFGRREQRKWINGEVSGDSRRMSKKQEAKKEKG